jgi:hypothetical protein
VANVERCTDYLKNLQKIPGNAEKNTNRFQPGADDMKSAETFICKLQSSLVKEGNVTASHLSLIY